jgi:glycosyltransferase involved in cell wall biosynthesis
VGFPFPLRAGQRTAALRPDVVLVVSGIEDLRLAAPYFELLRRATGGPMRRHFFQSTHPVRPPNAAFARVLAPYASVLCASEGILDVISPRAGGRACLFEPAVDVGALAAVVPAARSKPLRVGFVNHFKELKGADVALAAFAAIAEERDDVEFLAAGTGPLFEPLRERYAHLPSISWRGYLDDRERLSSMRACDVMVLPFRSGVSVLGLSQTVLECMAMGVAVVGTSTPAIAPAVADGREALLADDPGDVLPLVSKLLQDDDLRATLAGAAQARAAERYDVVARAREALVLLGLSA